MAVQCVTRIAPTTVITNDALSNPLPRNGRSASFSEVDMVSAGPQHHAGLLSREPAFDLSCAATLLARLLAHHASLG